MQIILLRVHMKTISQIFKNKDHEYERDRKQQKAVCTQHTQLLLHKYTLTYASNSFQINPQQQT